MSESTNDTYWFDRNVNYVPDHEEKEQIRQDIADLYDLRSAYPNLGGVITQRIERLEKRLKDE